MSPEEHRDIIRPYLKGMINEHKTIGEWKIQLTRQISFISRTDSKETRTMYTKRHNIEIMKGEDTDEIIKELHESLLQKYQEGLEESMRGGDFIRDRVDLLYCHLQKIGSKEVDHI